MLHVDCGEVKVERVSQCDPISGFHFSDLVLNVTVEGSVAKGGSAILENGSGGVEGPLVTLVTEDQRATRVRSWIYEDERTKHCPAARRVFVCFEETAFT